MVPSTLPNDSALMHVSDFERAHGAVDSAFGVWPTSTRLAELNPSLLQDLRRFAADKGPEDAGIDVLEVLAAARRHGRALLLHLLLDYRVIPLTVRPSDHTLLGPLTLEQLLALRLPDLRVLRVEPAPAQPSDDLHHVPLGPVLWEMALRGAREALLPEIGGVAAYRVTPGADFSALQLGGSLAAAVARLRRQATPLKEIASFPGFDHGRATRLLNALYLQSALMITRTHPGAIR